MEKLYEVDICKPQLIIKDDELSQYGKETIAQKVICIKDNDFYINIDTGEKYVYLKNDFNHILTCPSELSSSLEQQTFAISVTPYGIDLSEKKAAIDYLKAIKVRKILEEQRNVNSSIQRQKKKVG